MRGWSLSLILLSVVSAVLAVTELCKDGGQWVFIGLLMLSAGMGHDGARGEDDVPARSSKELEPSALLVADQDRMMKAAVRLGERKAVLQDGQYGLRYFPDGAMGIWRSDSKYRVLLAASVSSYLLEGESMERLRFVRKVLEPGEKGSFDNGYAGISGVYEDKATGELLALYHAEDQEGMPRLPNGVPGFYASVGLAVSQDGGLTFTKIGSVITSQQTKDSQGRPDQGCGEVCIVPDKERRYLLAYYVDHSRVQQRGVQICLARSPIASRGRPGSWRKFYKGSFREPGLGGRDTPVMSAQDIGADATFPHVTYSKKLNQYVMVFNINAYREPLQGAAPRQSGFYIAFSEEGTRWSKPVQLLAIYSVPTDLGQEIGWHPTLLWTDTEGAGGTGWLYYAYTERWGHHPPHKPHYLVGQRLVLTGAR